MTQTSRRNVSTGTLNCSSSTPAFRARTRLRRKPISWRSFVRCPFLSQAASSCFFGTTKKELRSKGIFGISRQLQQEIIRSSGLLIKKSTKNGTILEKKSPLKIKPKKNQKVSPLRDLSRRMWKPA